MRFIKSKLNNILKLLFYSLLIILVMILTHKHTSTNITPYKPKAMSNKHIREPTNDDKLIMMIKQNYAVNVPKQKKKQIHHREINAIITAYTANQESTGKTYSDPAYKITASGNKVIPHLTVACPPSIPLGAWIKIQGIGRRRCDDRGGAIKFKKFDLYVKDYDTAIKFGRQKRTVWIIGG